MKILSEIEIEQVQGAGAGPEIFEGLATAASGLLILAVMGAFVIGACVGGIFYSLKS
ncbi:MAG TPA: hypothetical protein VFP93_01480 [Gammaproteobacteria bacterium]|nr:hypothetical protein [Gammaproteobacteria bacterium]